jgi:hypothetical protein
MKTGDERKWRDKNSRILRRYSENVENQMNKVQSRRRKQKTKGKALSKKRLRESREICMQKEEMTTTEWLLVVARRFHCTVLARDGNYRKWVLFPYCSDIYIALQRPVAFIVQPLITRWLLLCWGCTEFVSFFLNESEYLHKWKHVYTCRPVKQTWKMLKRLLR